MEGPKQPCPKCVYVFALVAGKRLMDGTFETDLSRVLTVSPFSCPQCGYLELYKM
jgi:hypothetical protein